MRALKDARLESHGIGHPISRMIRPSLFHLKKRFELVRNTVPWEPQLIPASYKVFIRSLKTRKVGLPVEESPVVTANEKPIIPDEQCLQT